MYSIPPLWAQLLLIGPFKAGVVGLDTIIYRMKEYPECNKHLFFCNNSTRMERNVIVILWAFKDFIRFFIGTIHLKFGSSLRMQLHQTKSFLLSFLLPSSQHCLTQGSRINKYAEVFVFMVLYFPPLYGKPSKQRETLTFVYFGLNNTTTHHAPHPYPHLPNLRELKYPNSRGLKMSKFFL